VTIVIDASVALKWVLDEPGSDAAAALRDEELIAPTLWFVEAANAFWRNTGLGQLSRDEAAERLAELMNAPVASVAVETDLAAGLDLAMSIGHPIYNCLYLALAIRHQTYVVTADRRFAAVADLPQFAGRVRLIAA
jgi:predicted nucleic acid-binding protein